MYCKMHRTEFIPEKNTMTVQRWNDEMLDKLASSVTEVKDGIDGLRITAQALLQLAAQSQRDMELIKERQAESDQRFNVLLEEVRFLIRGNQAS